MCIKFVHKYFLFPLLPPFALLLWQTKGIEEHEEKITHDTSGP